MPRSVHVRFLREVKHDAGSSVLEEKSLCVGRRPANWTTPLLLNEQTPTFSITSGEQRFSAKFSKIIA